MGEKALVIKYMRLADIDRVLAIERASFSAPWSRYAFLSELLENNRAHYLVAWYNGELVGYIGVWLIADEGHITNIAVHPDYRRRGIATRLLEEVADLVRENKGRRLTLEVRISNVGAQKLYTQLGFASAGIRPRYYRDNNEDAIIMWQELYGDEADDRRISPGN